MTIPQNNIAMIPVKEDIAIVNIDGWKSPSKCVY